MSEFIITRVDVGSETFQRTYGKLPTEAKKEAIRALGMLLMLDITKAPAKLHLHALTDVQVKSALDSKQKLKRKVNVYTIHLTTNDKYKASFTFEDGTAYMRVAGEHDWVDENA